MKAVWNVLGAIVAGILSIALVLMLIVTPIVFSAMSLLNVDTITKAVVNAITSQETESEPQADSGKGMPLSVAGGSSSAEDIGEAFLTDMFGDEIAPQQIQEILSSNVVKELLEAYTDDLTNAIIGGDEETNFTAEKVKTIVNDNMDEIVGILQANIPELAETDALEIENEIRGALDEGLEELMEALPKPEQIKQQLLDGNPLLQAAASVLVKKNILKMWMIAGIALLSVLIFVCRLPGVRGFRWLATSLFIAGGISGLITAGLLMGKTVVGKITELAGAQAAGLITSLLDAFTTGVRNRTLIMLACGGVLLALYILLKRRTKAEDAEQIQSETLMDTATI